MLKAAAKDLQRLRRITRIIGKYGYDGFVKKSPEFQPDAADADFSSSGIRAGPASRGPRRFRAMLQELGPTFIKFGQLLSSRPDLVAQDYVEELKELQDHCEPLPFSDILRAVRFGLGQDPNTLFRRIEETPLATASIAQVHRGVTAKGDEVVLKVQRPGIDEEVSADIDILYRVARFLNAVIEESRLAEPVGIVREFDRALSEELNFQNEAANLREFKRLHEPRTDIVIPTVYPELSCKTVLTMSFLDGVPFSRLPDSADRKAVAERMVKEAFDEVFIDGVFHADPHPGNLLYLKDGRYGILDVGLLGRLTPQMQETLVVLALAIAVRDADTIARTLYRLGRSDERMQLSEVRDDTNRVFQTYLDRSIQDVDSMVLTQELLSLAMKHGIRVPPEYTMLARAGSTIEGMVREFHPGMDVAKVARPYCESLLMDRAAPENLEGGLYKAMLQFQGMSQDLPIQLSQILSDLSSGNFTVTVEGRHVERLNTSVLMAAATVAGAIVGGAFIIGSFIGLAQVDWHVFGVPVVGVFGATAGAVVSFWVGMYVFLRPRLKKVSLLRWFVKRR